MIKRITYNDLTDITEQAKKGGVKYLPECEFLGYYIDGKIVGTVGWTKHKNKYVLRNAFVMTEHRGKRIYEKLHKERLRLIEQEAGNGTTIELRCTRMSFEMHRRMGAVPIKSYKNYLHLEYYI
jgi:hypothetical protein